MTKHLQGELARRIYDLNMRGLEAENLDTFRELRGAYLQLVDLLHWMEAETHRALLGKEENENG